MALLCAGFAAGQEQEPQTGFTADVNLVLLHVAVIDPRGSDVPPLSVEDFTVFDDGVKQTVELFVAPADAPLDVALVLDSSASMKPVEMLARRAALSFLGRLAPDDCAFVLPFSDTAGPGRWGRSADPDLRKVAQLYMMLFSKVSLSSNGPAPMILLRSPAKPKKA